MCNFWPSLLFLISDFLFLISYFSFRISRFFVFSYFLYIFLMSSFHQFPVSYFLFLITIVSRFSSRISGFLFLLSIRTSCFLFLPSYFSMCLSFFYLNKTSDATSSSICDGDEEDSVESEDSLGKAC